MLYNTILNYIISYYITLYYIILYYIILYYIILYSIILHYIILYYIILYYMALYYIILYYIILYYIILYYIILYYIILYYITVYYITLYYSIVSSVIAYAHGSCSLLLGSARDDVFSGRLRVRNSLPFQGSGASFSATAFLQRSPSADPLGGSCRDSCGIRHGSGSSASRDVQTSLLCNARHEAGSSDVDGGLHDKLIPKNSTHLIHVASGSPFAVLSKFLCFPAP